MTASYSNMRVSLSMCFAAYILNTCSVSICVSICACTRHFTPSSAITDYYVYLLLRSADRPGFQLIAESEKHARRMLRVRARFSLQNKTLEVFKDMPPFALLDNPNEDSKSPSFVTDILDRVKEFLRDPHENPRDRSFSIRV